MFFFFFLYYIGFQKISNTRFVFFKYFIIYMIQKKDKKLMSNSSTEVKDKTTDIVEEIWTQQQPKLLLERFPYTQKDFSFPQVPQIYLTKSFFDNPFEQINDLYARGYGQLGIVKLILPPDLQVPQELVLGNLKKKLMGKNLETRIQKLNNLKSGEVNITQLQPYVANLKGYTYDNFQRYANQFSDIYDSQGRRESANDLRHNEQEFWSIVDNPDNYEDVEVEYAADLPVTKYSSGFQEDQLGNFCHLNKKKGSIFQVMNEKTELSGITIPWLYLGMKFSTFCWHCEDLFLNSVNYMHAGAPKTWYAVPPSHNKKFQELFKKMYSEQLKHNPKLLYDTVCQISPVDLVRNGIQVLTTDQKAGELILTFGATFHAGFSHGFNCSEAVNIAPVQWLDEYDKAVQEYRENGNFKKVCFPLEWILIELIQKREQAQMDFGWTKIHEKFKQLVTKEINIRKKIVELYENVKIIEYGNKNEKYDRGVCKICTHYMFMSHIQCGKCIKKGCTQHYSVCACEKPKIFMYIRYTEEELMELLEKSK
ncbi:hypothetical protein pb186bvf_010164 [Paramecium bursaria]